MYGFVSETESDKLRQCLVEISAEAQNKPIYSENEKHLLIRCSDRCKGGRCFTVHESNVIYQIHCRLPKVVSDEISTKPVVATETDSVSHKKQVIIDRVKEVKKAQTWMK